MNRLLLQGFLIFAALLAAGCSSSKAPQAAAPQPAAAPTEQPAATSTPAPVPLPAASSPAYPPITNLSNGMLIVGTIPGRAKVYLNNEYQGVTPLKAELGPGVHAVSIKLEGYRMVAEEVTVRSGEYTEMDLTLER